VIRELERGSLDAEQLISHTFALEQIQEAFTTQADAGRSIKVAVALDD
jgi:Zn-dependent alcohol dehydrogenase